jgi:hypothetical protein
MGRSVIATPFGILVKDGVYDLDQPAPIPEWQTSGDPCAKITWRHRTPTTTHPVLIRIPSSSTLVASICYHYAATRPLQSPNAVGRYHNTDPVLISYLIRLDVEKRGEEYLSFPQRALFDKLGLRTLGIETDLFGNFLGQGYEVGFGRDCAAWQPLSSGRRLDGERILPEGYAKFVSTTAQSAWGAGPALRLCNRG